MSDNEVPFRPLADLGVFVPKHGKRTAAMEAVDQIFLNNARIALGKLGCGALEFLAANPDASQLELAKQLNQGASALGLVMAIYAEAFEQQAVRNVSKNLLLRKIRQKYPDGWTSIGTVRAIVRIGGWEDDLLRSVQDNEIRTSADLILRELTINNPPPEGWKPAADDDPLINELFDRFWPTESPSAQS